MKKLIFSALLFLAACGNSSNDEPKDQINLNGSWTTSCTETKIEDLDVYSQSTYTFLGSEFDQSIFYFSDSACVNTQELSASAWIGSYGSFEIIDSTISSDGVEATIIELTYLGKGFESAGEINLRLAVYIENESLYFGTESNGIYSINFFYPYYLEQ